MSWWYYSYSLPETNNSSCFWLHASGAHFLLGTDTLILLWALSNSSASSQKPSRKMAKFPVKPTNGKAWELPELVGRRQQDYTVQTEEANLPPSGNEKISLSIVQADSVHLHGLRQQLLWPTICLMLSQIWIDQVTGICGWGRIFCWGREGGRHQDRALHPVLMHKEIAWTSIHQFWEKCWLFYMLLQKFY